jgi:hypothetical protein
MATEYLRPVRGERTNPFIAAGIPRNGPLIFPIERSISLNPGHKTRAGHVFRV